MRGGPIADQLPLLVRAEIAKAKAIGRTPFLEFGATWCGPCKELEASLRTKKEMIDAFAGTYIIHIDVDDWSFEGYGPDDPLPLGITGAGGIPDILAIDTTGMSIGEHVGLYGGTAKDAATCKEFFRAHLWKPAGKK